MADGLYFPIRFALTFDNKKINIVNTIDEYMTTYMQIDDYMFGSFLKKAVTYEPLFILEDVKASGPIAITRKSVTFDLIEDYLKAELSNYVRVSGGVPATYLRKYNERNIEPHFHKALWLCTFYRHR